MRNLTIIDFAEKEGGSFLQRYFTDFNYDLGAWLTIIIFMLLLAEILTGTAKAKQNGTLSSRKGKWSSLINLLLSIVFLSLSLLAISIPFNVLLPYTTINIDMGDCIGVFIASIHIYYTFVSIDENMTALGRPLPRFFSDGLQWFKRSFMTSSAKETARNVKKVSDVAKNPKESLEKWIDSDDKDDISTSEVKEDNQPQDNKKDSQSESDESKKAPEPTSAAYKEDK